MTQAERILELLRARGSRGLTALEALEAGAGMRLAARIADLRAAGHVITSETITVPSGARVAKYVLEQHTWHEAKAALDDMVNRRRVETGETKAEAAKHIAEYLAPRKVAQEPDNVDLWTEAEKREAWGK